MVFPFAFSFGLSLSRSLPTWASFCSPPLRTIGTMISVSGTGIKNSFLYAFLRPISSCFIVYYYVFVIFKKKQQHKSLHGCLVCWFCRFVQYLCITTTEMNPKYTWRQTRGLDICCGLVCPHTTN